MASAITSPRVTLPMRRHLPAPTSAGVLQRSGRSTRGNTNLKKNGVNYPVTFQTSIDIGDGTWLELGFPWDPGPQTVVVTMLWQVGTSSGRCPGEVRRTTEPPAPKPAFTMSKSSGTPGTTVNVTGTGYGKNETVRVYLDSSKTTAIATTTSDSTGAFSTSFTVPSTVGGPHRIHVVGRTSGLRTANTFKIMPLATSSKASGSASLSLTMTGTNFAAGEVVNVYWDGSATSAGRGTADSAGTVADQGPGAVAQWLAHRQADRQYLQSVRHCDVQGGAAYAGNAD